ncbi:glycoside hydrolase family 3 protein [Cyathus striatus]|nr:glycoside hydrolase family 3 protein [Cyathus striatus]
MKLLSFALAACSHEKLGIVRGTGQLNSSRRCVGDTTPVDRLGIPPGLRLVKNVTGFPTGINTASTFSRRLMRARGKALGEEFRGKGVHTYLGPAVDIMRNPKGGRGWESFGPDPYLNGEGAYETVTGVQSVASRRENQEHWRYGVTSNIDDRTMHELYWYPFLRSIEANVSSMMCAYNRVNGTSSCHNENLIGPNGLLQKAGFKGFVMSDWGATHDSASDNANAGLDMEQPGDYILIGGDVYSGLKSAVNNGSVSVDRLNQMVARILAPWYRLGQDQDYPPVNFDSQKPDGSGSRNLRVNVRTAEHTALVKEIASASAVLLKNNRTTTTGTPTGTTIRGLPVSASMIKTVAVVGKDAKLPNLSCNDLNECNDGTMSVGWGSGSNSLEFIVPPIDAITAQVGSSATITQSLSNDLDEALMLLRARTYGSQLFARRMSGELGFYDTVEGNQGDRNDLDLWWKGGSLVERVAAVCNNTIVVVHSVGPVYMTWSTNANVTAIIYAGAPGEQTGPSIVDVLYGNYNPSGRLPFSIADNEAAYGTTIVYNSLTGFPSVTSHRLSYMDGQNITPRFEFGYGLSYTTFSYSSLSIKSSGTSYTISFTVTNTGAFDGTEKPQLYLGFPAAAGEPKKVLRGFEEVPLTKGASSTVTMTLSQRDISIWDVPNQAYVRPSGTFTFMLEHLLKMFV